jgi:hypothetical protein
MKVLRGRRPFAGVWLAALICAATPALAEAQRLDLSISPTTVVFPAADPDTVPVITSGVVQISYRIQQNNFQPWMLSVLAGGDLISGSARVDISNISWVATPSPPFQNGVMSKTVAQRVASGTGNVASTTVGQITFQLANSWNYVPGLYTQTVVFTLTAP